MGKGPDSTLSLIGRAVKNIHDFTDVFYDNRKYCMWADNIMERCDNEENPTVFCDPENCPLAESILGADHVARIISTRS